MSPTIVIITGTCASGKTSLGRYISQHFGLAHVDGDCVRERLQANLPECMEKKSVHWNAIHNEIIAEAFAVMNEKGVVITHVILPEMFKCYLQPFRSRGYTPLLRILLPQRSILLQRNRERSCWTTPEKYIDLFQNRFLHIEEKWKGCVIDSSQESIAQTVNRHFVDFGQILP